MIEAEWHQSLWKCKKPPKRTTAQRPPSSKPRYRSDVASDLNLLQQKCIRKKSFYSIVYKTHIHTHNTEHTKVFTLIVISYIIVIYFRSYFHLHKHECVFLFKFSFMYIYFFLMFSTLSAPSESWMNNSAQHPGNLTQYPRPQCLTILQGIGTMCARSTTLSVTKTTKTSVDFFFLSNGIL